MKNIDSAIVSVLRGWGEVERLTHYGFATRETDLIANQIDNLTL